MIARLLLVLAVMLITVVFVVMKMMELRTMCKNMVMAQRRNADSSPLGRRRKKQVVRDCRVWTGRLCMGEDGERQEDVGEHVLIPPVPVDEAFALFILCVCCLRR